MSTSHLFWSIVLSKVTLVVWILAVLSLTSCQDAPVSPEEQQIAAFSQQLDGEWVLDEIIISSPKTSGEVTIKPHRSSGCGELGRFFNRKDIVNSYKFQYTDKTLRVRKNYSCQVAPEELLWIMEVAPDTAEPANWMLGKNFTIKEVNEAMVNAKFDLLFFNLDHNAPNGKPAPASRKNTLWLNVIYDHLEDVQFTLKFAKKK